MAGGESSVRGQPTKERDRSPCAALLTSALEPQPSVSRAAFSIGAIVKAPAERFGEKKATGFPLTEIREG